MSEPSSPQSPVWDLVALEPTECEDSFIKSEDSSSAQPVTPTRTPKKCKPRTVPRQDSPKAIHPLNFTSFRADQAAWSWENMPDVLYKFKPDEKRDRKFESIPMKYPIHGQILRELPVLPDNIASTVEEFRVEAWMRMDRRVRLKDITDRMHPAFRVNGNALQQRSVRFRQVFGMIAWDSGNKRSRQLEVELLKIMREKGIDPTLNTTRGITPGLINPMLGEAGGRVPLPGRDSNQKGQVGGKWSPKKSGKENKDVIRPAVSFRHRTSEATNVQAQPLLEQAQANPYCGATPAQGGPEWLDLIPQSVPSGTRGGAVDDFTPAPESHGCGYGLTETTTMGDIHLLINDPFSVPNRTLPKALRPIAPEKVTKLNPSPISLHRNMCHRGCHGRETPTPVPMPPAPRLNPIEPHGDSTRPPSFEHFQPLHSPFPDTSIPPEVRSDVFQYMLDQCLDDRRYLFELPYIPDVMESDHMDTSAYQEVGSSY